MAARRKRKASASRGGSKGGSSMTWFVSGLIMGTALAVFLFHKGYLPAPPRASQPDPVFDSSSEPELLDDSDGIISRDSEPRYDFFTVLPEMEVVVPQQQLSDQAQPDAAQSSESADEQFVLQAGSFRSAADADQMKARLALLGSSATVQKVTVNNESWHRVRIGPVNGARQADEVRRRLLDNGIEVLVLKISS